MTLLTQHFAEHEFVCRCGCCGPPSAPARDTPVQVKARFLSLAQALEALRVKVGKPVTINSGYRCPTRNRAVGGAKGSQHLVGGAVDVAVDGYTGKELASILEALVASNEIPDGGIGLYADKPEIVHYDQRGRHARWGP